MNLHNSLRLGAIVLAATAASPAIAANQVVDLSSGFATLSGNLPVFPTGLDMILLTGVDAGSYSISLNLAGNLPNSVTLNGVAPSEVGTLLFSDFWNWHGFQSDGKAIELNIYGSAFTTTPGLSYYGTISTYQTPAVPEPQAYALMTLGLIAVGTIAAKRRQPKMAKAR